MLSKNITVFAAINAVLLTALLIGVCNNPAATTHKQTAPEDTNVPCIGKIQVLNGHGGEGAADDVAGFLRAKKFDVINIGNAPSWNYPFTLVISRTKDMTIAQLVAGALKTDRVVLVRNEERAYDVTVIIGHDYKERTK